jgi:hypothetical protein
MKEPWYYQNVIQASPYRTYSLFIHTNIACAVGPSVNTFFIFHIFRIENFQIQECEHIDGSPLIFPSKLKFFNLFEFPATKFTKNQYLSQLSSENCEINSIKSDLSKGFPTTPRTSPTSNTVF